MKTISKDFGWALLALVMVSAVLKLIGIKIESVQPEWWILLLALIIAVVFIIIGHWPKKDYSKEHPQLILPDRVISAEPSRFKKIIKWLKEN